ncbi:hypothetical protein U3516DRAFT_893386, partial [Neocallimastix sp. 'constans']
MKVSIFNYLFIMVTSVILLYGPKVTALNTWKEKRLGSKRVARRDHSYMGKNHHMFSCIRKMKYWNGISCEDFTQKTCEHKKYYWDEGQKKCYFSHEIACQMNNRYWSVDEGCIEYNQELCEQQNMIWDYDTKTCGFQQNKIEYIDIL